MRTGHEDCALKCREHQGRAVLGQAASDQTRDARFEELANLGCHVRRQIADGGDDREGPARLFGEGHGIKRIASDLRLSRNTVPGIARADETEHVYRRREQPLP